MSTKRSHILKQAAGLFKYVWTFSGHQALKRSVKAENVSNIKKLSYLDSRDGSIKEVIRAQISTKTQLNG